MTLFRRLRTSPLWNDQPTDRGARWRAEPERVEELIGYRFLDRELLIAALDRRAAPYGPLETLGDAINDLAVAVAVVRAGRSLREATALVTNVRLQQVYDTKLANTARFADGDVVETLIGAVHLDAGFNKAATLGVRLCTGLTWTPIPDRELDDGAPILGGPPFADTERSMGSLVLQAALIDHWVRTSTPNWPSSKQLTELCALHTSRRFFREIGRQRTTLLVDSFRYRNAVKVGVARLLTSHGWSTASRTAVGLLVRTSDDAE